MPTLELQLQAKIDAKNNSLDSSLLAMLLNSASPLAAIEPRLRTLLPVELYAQAWINPSPARLMLVFNHLRTLQRILHDYVPRQVLETPPQPGVGRYNWQEGTLLFTDLAGFTPLLEANAIHGRAGAEALMGVLNAYFAQMIEIISKSGGDLLEFTGDALLVQFTADQHHSDTTRAVRAGLRMQRAMKRFEQIETELGIFSLSMRVGIYAGKFLAADIGTPRRMEHVLLGNAVRKAKWAEGAGQVGRVCLTKTAQRLVQQAFDFEPGAPGHMLVVDKLSAKELGEYDLTINRRKNSNLLFDRSTTGLVSAISEVVERVEPLASYLPLPILNLVVENVEQRKIPPNFITPTVVFVGIVGVPRSIDARLSNKALNVVSSLSRVFSLVNAAVEAQGGILRKVTYQLVGSDILIYFGLPNVHTDDPLRASKAVLAIRDIITRCVIPDVGDKSICLSCQIGVALGPVFAAEFGEPRGRREFNVLGDTVNTAARLMRYAAKNQILVTEAVKEAIAQQFKCESLGAVALKGKVTPTPIFALHNSYELPHLEIRRC